MLRVSAGLLPGSGAEADAVLAAAVAVALAVAEEEQRQAGQGAGGTPATTINPWVLDGRRRLMDSRGRPSR